MLYYAAVQKQCAGGAAKTGYLLSRPAAEGRRIELRRIANKRRRGLEDEFALLERAKDPTSTIDAYHLLRASHALTHSWQSQFLMTRSHRESGRMDETLRVLGRLERDNSPEARSYAREHLGQIEFQEGRYEDARQTYRLSVEEGGSRLSRSGSWFVNAIMLNDEEDALCASAALGEAPLVQNHLKGVVSRLRHLDPLQGADPKVRDLAAQFAASSTEPVREIAHALAM